MNGQLTRTALGPSDPDDGDVGPPVARHGYCGQGRHSRRTRSATRSPLNPATAPTWSISTANPSAPVPDFERRQQPCKHIYAVEFIIQREERPDGTTIETKTMRVTYRQDWPAYNVAQVHEQEYFGMLLRDLCDTIP